MDFPLRLIQCCSHKKVTQKMYSKVWKKINCWTAQRAAVIPDLPSVLDFLQKSVDKGFSMSTLKVQVAALSVFFFYFFTLLILLCFVSLKLYLDSGPSGSVLSLNGTCPWFCKFWWNLCLNLYQRLAFS